MHFNAYIEQIREDDRLQREIDAGGDEDEEEKDCDNVSAQAHRDEEEEVDPEAPQQRNE